MINRVIRDSGIGIDVHVISREEGASADEPRSRRTRRPRGAAAPTRAARLRARPRRPAAAHLVLAHLRDHLGLPSVLLLYLLLVVGVAAVGGVWPALAAAVARLPARELVLHAAAATRSRSPRARTSSRWPCSSRWQAPSAPSSRWRRAAPRRARALGPRPRRSRRLAGASPLPALLESLRSSVGFDAARRVPPGRRRWRVEAASGPAPAGPEERRVGRGRPDRTCSCSSGRSAPASDDQPILDAFTPRSPRRSRSRSSRPRPPRPGASPPRTSSARRSSRPSRTTSAPRSPAIKASATSLLQEDVDWTRRAARVPRHDRRGDRPPGRARRQPARHEPPPDRRARACARSRSASRRSCPPRSSIGGRART